MSERKGLEGLTAWRRSLDFAKRIYTQVIPILPKEEKWVMASQLRRASSSISANIAEGYGRFYFQEGVRYCYLARGSLEEALSFLTLARELNYLPEDVFGELQSDAYELKKIINGYVVYLKNSKQGENEPGSGYSVREPIRDHFANEQDDDFD